MKLGPPWRLGRKRINRRCRRPRFDPWVWKIHWTRKQTPTPGFLPGASQGQTSPVGCNPRRHKHWDTTEQWPRSPAGPRELNAQSVTAAESALIRCTCLHHMWQPPERPQVLTTADFNDRRMLKGETRSAPTTCSPQVSGWENHLFRKASSCRDPSVPSFLFIFS